MEAPTARNDVFQPSLRDVFVVKDILLEILQLPREVVDDVVDLAEYWPHTSTVGTGGPITVQGGNNGMETAVPNGSGSSENRFVLRTYPLGYLPREGDPISSSIEDHDGFPTGEPKPWVIPEYLSPGEAEDTIAQIRKTSKIREEYPCRKIIFTIKSHDQGWGGKASHRGTYTGSYTWFDVGQERLISLKDTRRSTSPPPQGGNGIPIEQVTNAVEEDEEEEEEEEEEQQESPWPNLISNLLSPLPTQLPSTSSSSSSSNANNASKSTKTPSSPPLGRDRLQTLTPEIHIRNPAHGQPQPEPHPYSEPQLQPYLQPYPQPQTQPQPQPNDNNTGFFSHALLPDDNNSSRSLLIQKNKTARLQTQTNVITWRYDDDVNPDPNPSSGSGSGSGSVRSRARMESHDDAVQDADAANDEDAANDDDEIEKGRGGRANRTGEFVRGVRVGDTVTVWAKARFPGWVNVVVEVGIDIYWAI